MSEAVTLTPWLLLAVVQQHGSVALTAGTPEACQEARAKLLAAPETIALSRCLPVELVRYQAGEPLRAPRVAP